MLRNHLIIAIRSMTRNGMTTAISVAGLAIAFGVAILVTTQSMWEMSFNTQLGDTSDIYRIIRSTKQNEGEIRYDVHTSGGLTGVLREEYPAAASVTRLFRRRMITDQFYV